MRTKNDRRDQLWPSRQLAIGAAGGLAAGAASTLIMVHRGTIRTADFTPLAGIDS